MCKSCDMSTATIIYTIFLRAGISSNREATPTGVQSAVGDLTSMTMYFRGVESGEWTQSWWCVLREPRGGRYAYGFLVFRFYARVLWLYIRGSGVHATQCILHTASLHTVKISSGIISQEPMRSSRSSTGHCALWSDTLL